MICLLVNLKARVATSNVDCIFEIEGLLLRVKGSVTYTVNVAMSCKRCRI